MGSTALPPAALVHVVVAALVDDAGRVLLARRGARQHQGGRWELPGGKLEPGEGVEAGLARELREELGITPTRQRPLIRIAHRYPDRAVLLDAWRVEAWQGRPHAREGQPLEWVPPGELAARDLPAASRPIATALTLPDCYLITPEPAGPAFLEGLERSLQAGVGLVQLRARSRAGPQLEELARAVLACCRRHGARLLLNTDPALAERVASDGVHLSAARLAACRERPLPPGRLVAASCHDGQELEQAARVGVDFVVLSPVLATPSHPGAAPLGWGGLRALTERCPVPAYALGGMRREDLPLAWIHGAQGIAAIRGLWAGGTEP